MKASANVFIKAGLMIVCMCVLTPALAQPYNEMLVPIQVIVNTKTGLTTLNRQQVMSLFLGRARSFPNGHGAKPFDYQIGSKLRMSFFEWLTGKSIADIDAYWARLRYSGRTSPPRVINDSAKTLAVVSQNQQAIAYIRQQDPLKLKKMGIIVVYTINGRAQAL
jgi:hypothetical protein